jgi:hypothetical protein
MNYKINDAHVHLGHSSVINHKQYKENKIINYV